MNILEIFELTKKYKQNTVLENINFKIPQNSITGIIGPNGAGKSTVLKLITGFETITSGKILYKNQEITNLNDKMKIFSYMPENMKLYPDYTIEELLCFYKKTTENFSEEIFKNLGLFKIKRKKIKNLSKGYKQRLKLFFAISNNKEIILLDEPFDGFDPIQLLEILKLIKKINKTFIVSIHQLYDAEKICDYFVLLNDKKVIAEGNLESLRKKFNVNGHLEDIFIKALS